MITAVTTKKKRSDLSRFRRILRPRQQLRCLAEFDDDELDFDSRKCSRASAERESESEDNRERNKLKLVLKLPPVRHVSRPESSESTSGSETSASEEESEEDEIVKPLKKRRVERTRDLSCGSGQRVESKRNVIKRPIRSVSGTPMPKISYLEGVLDKLQMKDTYRVFAQPVNPEELPDYHDVIERPMDFGTVRRKLVSRWYRTFEQFEDDVFLICSNAMQYNAPDTVYFNQAYSIQDMARSKFREIRANQTSSRAERKYEENIRPVHIGKNMEKNTQSANAPKHSGYDRSFIHKKSTQQNDRRDVLKSIGHAMISKQKKDLKTIFEKKHETSKVYSPSMITEMTKRPSDASYTEKTPRKPQYKVDVGTKEAENSKFSDKKLIRKPHFNIATAPRSSGFKKTQHRTDPKPPDAGKDQLKPRKVGSDIHITGKKPVLHKPYSKTEFIGSNVKLEDISYVGNTSIKKHPSKDNSESFDSDILFHEKKIEKQDQKRTEPESLASDHKSVKKPLFKSKPQENKIQYHPSKVEAESLGSNHKSLKKFQSKRDPESFGFDISLKKCRTRTEYPSRDEPESLGLDHRSLKKPHPNVPIEKKTEIAQPRTELESLSSELSSPKKPQIVREPESFGSYTSSQTRKTHIDHVSRAEPESLGSDNTSLEKHQSKGDPQSSGSYVSSQEKRTQIEHPCGTEPESHGSDFSSAVTLAMSDDTLTGFSKKQAIKKSICEELIAQDMATCTNFSKVDESVAINVSAEASFLHDDSSEDEDDTPAKGSPSKHIHDPIAVDTNRRATYNKYEEEPTTTAHPIFDALDDETRELVSVSPKSEHSYARSLARFAFQLGPIGWDIASQKIEQCLPPEIKFGPGWVGEHEHRSSPVLPFQNSSKNTRNGVNGSNRMASTSNKANRPPHNLPKAQNICFRSSEKPSPQPVASNSGWTQVQNGTRKQDRNIEKSKSSTAVLSQGWTQVQNNVIPLIKVKAEPNTDDSPNALPTAYANLQKNQLPFQSNKSSEINFSRTQPQHNYPQFETHYWQPNTVVSPTVPYVRVANGATAKWKRSIHPVSPCVIEGGGANARQEFSQGVMDNNNSSRGQQSNKRLFVFPDLNLNFQPPVSPTFSSLDSQQQPDLALQL